MSILALFTGSTIIQTLVVGLISDRGGAWAAKILGKRGLLGFGTSAAKAAATHRKARQHQAAKQQTRDWLTAELAALDAAEAKAPAPVPVKVKPAAKRRRKA